MQNTACLSLSLGRFLGNRVNRVWIGNDPSVKLLHWIERRPLFLSQTKENNVWMQISRWFATYQKKINRVGFPTLEALQQVRSGAIGFWVELAAASSAAGRSISASKGSNTQCLRTSEHTNYLSHAIFCWQPCKLISSKSFLGGNGGGVSKRGRKKRPPRWWLHHRKSIESMFL